jgi:4-hydroxybenzoate polyprenyltransferase
MLAAGLGIAAVVCAVLAIRASRLLSAALWLAVVSALVSIILYELGARQVAVIELSVGAGLVTVLFVFAISIAGDDGLGEASVLPRWLAVGAVGVLLVLLVGMALPVAETDAAAGEFSIEATLWDQRALDVLVQIVLIFTGVLCLLGLLAETRLPAQTPAQPVAAHVGRTEIPPVDQVPDEPVEAPELEPVLEEASL